MIGGPGGGPGECLRAADTLPGHGPAGSAGAEVLIETFSREEARLLAAEVIPVLKQRNVG